MTQREHVVELYKAGFQLQRIEALTGLKKNTVYKYLNGKPTEERDATHKSIPGWMWDEWDNVRLAILRRYKSVGNG